MNVGIKFCGGCNPRYNRKKILEYIKEKCKNVSFEYVKEEMKYDHLLVIGGCSNNCASYEQYNVAGIIYKIYNEEQVDNLIREINRRI